MWQRNENENAADFDLVSKIVGDTSWESIWYAQSSTMTGMYLEFTFLRAC